MLTCAGEGARLLVVSHPKTGRTWLRFMLANYLKVQSADSAATRVTLRNVYDFVPNFETEEHGRGLRAARRSARIPLMAMDHSLPNAEHANFALALLIRDPRDVAVSHWHHAKWHYNSPVIAADASEFADENWVDTYFNHLSEWLTFRDFHPGRVRVLSYENLHAEPHETLTGLLLHAGIEPCEASVNLAVTASTFSQMRAVEVAYGMKGIEYDRSNVQALRVRSGKVGGYRDVLDSAALGRISRGAARWLSPQALAVLERYTDFRQQSHRCAT